jgi:hypothetical protein
VDLTGALACRLRVLAFLVGDEAAGVDDGGVVLLPEYAASSANFWQTGSQLSPA